MTRMGSLFARIRKKNTTKNGSSANNIKSSESKNGNFIKKRNHMINNGNSNMFNNTENLNSCIFQNIDYINDAFATLDNLQGDGIEYVYRISIPLKQKLRKMNFTDVEISEVRRAFKLYDKNATGKITRKSFLWVMRSLGQNPTEDEFDDMLNEIDADRNGLIEFSEFLELVAEETEKKDETIAALFHTFEYKGCGFVKLDHLRTMLLMGGSNLNDSDVDYVFEQFETDGHGNVSMEDFVRVMKMLPTLATNEAQLLYSHQQQQRQQQKDKQQDKPQKALKEVEVEQEHHEQQQKQQQEQQNQQLQILQNEQHQRQEQHQQRPLQQQQEQHQQRPLQQQQQKQQQKHGEQRQQQPSPTLSDQIIFVDGTEYKIT